MFQEPYTLAFPTSVGLTLAERLEQPEVVYYPTCPFSLPEGDDRRFLLEQQLGPTSKNVSFEPERNRMHDYQRRTSADTQRLHELLAAFSRNVSAWLAHHLPGYATAWQLDQVTFRPVEEATRQLRLKARNDLVHVDAFPSRPSQGRRILRCFVNINPTEPRIWITSDPFAVLLERHGHQVGLPEAGSRRWAWQLREQVLQVFRPGRPRRSAYDAFMLRFHDFLKADEVFQERCRKRTWKFAPGSMWLCFTDAVSHAALRGRYALEHSYFVPVHVTLRPELSPLALLEKASGQTELSAA
ncbi:MAG: Kdo hydroxylase family protein [Gemmataceae bacterium]|nr:Kdo hydroxylase family protein [Gemmataceae bacterium]